MVAQLLKNKQNALGEVLAGRDLPRDAKLIAVMTDIDLAAPNEPEASPSKAAIVAKPETALESPYKESKAARSKEKSSSAVQKSLAQKRKREEVDVEKKEAEKKKEKKRERKNRKKEEEKKKKQKNQQFVGKQVRKFFPGEDDEGGQWYEGEVTELKKCKDDGSSEDEEAGKVAINPDEDDSFLFGVLYEDGDYEEYQLYELKKLIKNWDQTQSKKKEKEKKKGKKHHKNK